MNAEPLPGRRRFLELARDHDVVPVVLELTSDTVTPYLAWRRLARRGRNPFLLESVEGGERTARYSFAGIDPCSVVEIRGGTAFVDGAPREGDPVRVLREAADWGTVAPVEGTPPFAGGALGYLGYDAVRLVEAIPDTGRDEDGLPEAWFGIYDAVVAVDHARQRLILTVATRPGNGPAAAWEAAMERLERLREAVQPPGDEAPPRPVPAVAPPAAGEWAATPSAPRYLEAVARAKEAIAAGEIFQVVLSRRFRKLPDCTVAEIYRMLRLTNPSPYMFLLDTGTARVAGASPEMLVQVRDGVARTCPIAGTRPRGATPGEDARLAAELLADPKERAEHVMLVDLGRNDIGRIAEPGTVRLAREMVIERYSHVMHIVSEVEGRLREGLDAWDALMACFPAGTLTGAPKVRAMEIIDELEGVRRGPYGGAIAYRTFGGDLDSCITIRTLIERGGVVQVQAGAGIVHDSVPERELEECLNKARALMQAVAMAEAAAGSGVDG